jgi:NAD(P)H-dependent FMN reductase
MTIGIIIGSIREGRAGASVAQWVAEHAARRDATEFEVIDLKEFDVPLLTAPLPPAAANREYDSENVRRWSRAIDACEGFVFVTPEYNHGTSAALKNAIDFLYAEWNNKAAGFVSYGSAGGARAVEQLRLVLSECQVAHVRAQVMLSLMTDFEKFSVFKPHARHEQEVTTMLDQLLVWADAMKMVRSGGHSLEKLKAA